MGYSETFSAIQHIPQVCVYHRYSENLKRHRDTFLSQYFSFLLSASFQHCSILVFIYMFFFQRDKKAKFQSLKKKGGGVLSEIGEHWKEKKLPLFFTSDFTKLRAIPLPQRTPCTCIFCFLLSEITNRLYAHFIRLNTQFPILPMILLKVAKVTALRYWRQFHCHHTNTSHVHVVITDCSKLTLRRLMSYIYIYIYIYMEHPFLMFLDHTQRRSTVGRTPLDE